MGLFIPLVHYLFGLDSRKGIMVHSRFKIQDSIHFKAFKAFRFNFNSNIQSLDFGGKSKILIQGKVHKNGGKKHLYYLEKQVTTIQGKFMVKTPKIYHKKLRSGNYTKTLNLT